MPEILHENQPVNTWDLLQALFGCLAVHKLSLGGAEAGVDWGHRGAVVFRERPGATENKEHTWSVMKVGSGISSIPTAEMATCSTYIMSEIATDLI